MNKSIRASHNPWQERPLDAIAQSTHWQSNSHVIEIYSSRAAFHGNFVWLEMTSFYRTAMRGMREEEPSRNDSAYGVVVLLSMPSLMTSPFPLIACVIAIVRVRTDAHPINPQGAAR